MILLLGALLGTGVGYMVWGRQVAALEAEVGKLQGWIGQEMRGSDERNRSAETRVRELEAEVGRLQGALGSMQTDLRAEQKRRRTLEEQIEARESRRFR